MEELEGVCLSSGILAKVHRETPKVNTKRSIAMGTIICVAAVVLGALAGAGRLAGPVIFNTPGSWTVCLTAALTVALMAALGLPLGRSFARAETLDFPSLEHLSCTAGLCLAVGACAMVVASVPVAVTMTVAGAYPNDLTLEFYAALSFAAGLASIGGAQIGSTMLASRWFAPSCNQSSCSVKQVTALGKRQPAKILVGFF